MGLRLRGRSIACSARSLGHSMIVSGFCGLAIASAAQGQTTGPATETAEPPATASQPATEAPKPGPHYELLRYNDDFSYLDGPPGSYKPDFFDPIKRIHLGEDFIVGFGGETRGRLESITNKNYGQNQGRGPNQTPTQDTFFLHRYYYHSNIQYRKLLRIFVDGVSAWGEDRDKYTPLNNYQDRFDVHQLFADLRVLGEETPLTLRFGRQEISYGRQRTFALGDWPNLRRTWDGVKVFWADPNYNLDVFYAKPVEIRNLRPDVTDEDIDVYGVYSTWKRFKQLSMELYFFAVDNTGRYTNANYRAGDVGDSCVYTPGIRLFGKVDAGPGTWDYDAEATVQWGKAAGDTIRAGMWSIDTGYTLSKLSMKPRIGIGADYASGDDDPFDNTHGTYNQLYPLGHAYFGFLDQIGRQNIWAQNVNFTFVPVKDVTTALAFHTFWLDKNRDALYNAAGQVVRRSVYGEVGDLVGNELDLTIRWQIDPHASLLFGYSHMWTSRHFFSGPVGSAEDPDLFYLQYHYLF